MRVADIPEIDKLSPPEKILLIEDIWDSIAFDESHVPVAQSHRDELSRRMLRYTSHPGDLLSLAELQEKIDRQK